MERLHLMPYLYQKLLFTPGNFDHPVWVTDPNFDIDQHVLSAELPAPGNFKQLEDKIAEIHAELLDRQRPLWKLCVISGLEDKNQIAYYSAAHHACLDGVSGTEATELLMDRVPQACEFTPPENFPPQENPAWQSYWD